MINADVETKREAILKEFKEHKIVWLLAMRVLMKTGLSVDAAASLLQKVA